MLKKDNRYTKAKLALSEKRIGYTIQEFWTQKGIPGRGIYQDRPLLGTGERLLDVRHGDSG